MTRSIWAIRMGLLFVLFSVALTLQTALFGHLPLFGLRADLVLLIVISLGFLRGPTHGLLIGLAGGFMVDLLSGFYIGLSGIVAGSVGLLAGVAGLRLIRDSLAVMFLLTLVLTVWKELAYLAGFALFGARLPELEPFLHSALLVLVGNGVLILFLHRPLERLNDWVERHALVPHRVVPMD